MHGRDQTQARNQGSLSPPRAMMEKRAKERREEKKRASMAVVCVYIVLAKEEEEAWPASQKRCSKHTHRLIETQPISFWHVALATWTDQWMVGIWEGWDFWVSFWSWFCFNCWLGNARFSVILVQYNTRNILVEFCETPPYKYENLNGGYFSYIHRYTSPGKFLRKLLCYDQFLFLSLRFNLYLFGHHVLIFLHGDHSGNSGQFD